MTQTVSQVQCCSHYDSLTSSCFMFCFLPRINTQKLPLKGLELLDNISIVKLNHTHHGDTPATPSRRSDEWCTGLSLSVFALLIIQSIEWSSPTGISKTNVTEDASTLDRNLRVEKISLTLLLPRFSYIIRCMRLIHWTLLENISG